MHTIKMYNVMFLNFNMLAELSANQMDTPVGSTTENIEKSSHG